LTLVRDEDYTANANQTNMTLEGTPTSAPGATTIVYANQRSAGPKVFGALAMLLGGVGVLLSLLGILDSGDSIKLWGAEDTSLKYWFYVYPLIGLAAGAVFTYAGYLLWQYKRRGVWLGFGAVGINAIGGVLQSVMLGMITEEVGEAAGADGLGGIVAGAGILMTAFSAVCCGLIVALPLLMNGNDLVED